MVRSVDKHNDVLCAAITEFAKKGMVATTMEAIATRANVSKRTLYKHYSSKDALFDAVVALLFQRLANLPEVQYQSDVPVREQLKQLAQLSIGLSADPDYMRLSKIVIIESMRSESRAKRLDEQFKGCEQGLHSWFIQAELAGALGLFDAKLTASLFFGGIKKMTFWDQAIRWQHQVNEEELSHLINQTCLFFEKGLKQ
ncbi:TetR/AcrR family transcriptional regulator [Pseudoalteromonas tunicata]|uniref:Hypothetical transcriptional regulator n=1 Tax=Pseudoalteromonas tunicata D2 TaxID=87626 RepID=A4CC29_9GAMM|nr:TetR/AcrR family transcriptional regulator [Pseudoalteromonas tunicata]ATC94465.1 hypothetical protein PTUN_a1907 [Pseudoalteromonas tunicata]AXT30195.1 TetR/AcrR family transcriptional regulator [Pseudoalteromonas tunicata]EAR27916.1 hypothetical transcriptional regulator [Pseudoalteromonas tunicata D2]